MKKFFWILWLIPFFYSCKNKPTPGSPAPKDSSQFYPLSHFIQQEIDDVELGNYAIMELTDTDGKRDSAALSKDDFQKIAAGFKDKDVSTPAFKERFTETVFHDLSTQSYTINYKPKHPSEEIQNIDILLDEKNNLVKRVFIRSESQQTDGYMIEQMNWKAGQHFQINWFLKAANGKTSNKLLVISWKKIQP